MSANFNLTRFKNGEPVKTRDGSTSMTFVAVLPEGTPAPLVVRRGNSEAMENYFINGSYLSPKIVHDEDLVMAGYFD